MVKFVNCGDPATWQGNYRKEDNMAYEKQFKRIEKWKWITAPIWIVPAVIYVAIQGVANLVKRK